MMASAMLACSALGGVRPVPASLSRLEVIESAQNTRVGGPDGSGARQFLIPPGPSRPK